MVSDIYPVRTDKEFVRTLEDNIRDRGAMDVLYSEAAKAETSKWVANICRGYVIQQKTSEPHMQHQNYGERRYQTIKTCHKRVMNRTGAPAAFWFLGMCYVIYVLNHMAVQSLGWRTPLEKLTGVTPDRSPIVRYQFWEPVYFIRNEAGFPSDSSEALGRFVRFAENVGRAMTYKVWDPDVAEVLFRSRIRSAVPPGTRNYRLENADDVDPVRPFQDEEYVRFAQEQRVKEGWKLADFDPQDMIDQTFIQPEPDPDGTQHRFKVVKPVDVDDPDMNPAFRKFICRTSEGDREAIYDYQEIKSLIDKQDAESADGEWHFKNILSHRKSKGKLEVHIWWENGEKTWEPLEVIAVDDPV